MPASPPSKSIRMGRNGHADITNENMNSNAGIPSSSTETVIPSKKHRILRRLTNENQGSPPKIAKLLQSSEKEKSIYCSEKNYSNTVIDDNNFTVNNTTVSIPEREVNDKISAETVLDNLENLSFNGSYSIITKEELIIEEENEAPVVPTVENEPQEETYPNTSTPTAANEDESSRDSTNLQIVLPGSAESDIDKEIEEDIEKELDKKAKRTNLTVKNVKSILRYVIGNESVLKMVRNSMKNAGESDGDIEFMPKLTRSKARQLRENKQIIWPLSPIHPRPPAEEHLVLISEELPEEEDDDEYRPSAEDLGDHSDDDTTGRMSVTSSCNTSIAGHYVENFDSGLLDEENALQTPERPIPETPRDEFDFKRPIQKRPENIGQRTRSKLSLSSTPLEAIEQAFAPPDITTDMYDFKCDNQEWENFLKEFMQPLPSDQADADVDEEDDPEYNILAEEEELDKEELRRDKGVTVSRAELRTLMSELFENPEEASSDEETAKEKGTVDASATCNDQDETEAVEESDSPSSRAPTPEPEIIGMTLNQKLLLQQQLRQHVQLLTQHFLQTHCHPLYSLTAGDAKIMLAEFVELGSANPRSLINVYNLYRAFTLMEEWEAIMESPVGKEIIKHMENEKNLDISFRAQKVRYVNKFHKRMMDIVVNSDVFLYPLFLPPQPFRSSEFTCRFIDPELELMVLGLEEFVPYVKDKENRPWYEKRMGPERAACTMIHEYLLPRFTPQQIWMRFTWKHKVPKESPLYHYKLTKKAPPVMHHVIPFNSNLLIPPKDQNLDILPPVWEEYVRQNYPRKCKKTRASWKIK